MARFFRILTARLCALLPQRCRISEELDRMTDAYTTAQRRVTELKQAHEKRREEIAQLRRWLAHERAFIDGLSRQERADHVRLGQTLLFAEGTYRGEVTSIERDEAGRVCLGGHAGFGVRAKPSEKVTVWG